MTVSTATCYIDHMRKRLRLFFLCLLIVSLPVQSIAGMIRVECSMSHHPLDVSGVQADDMLTPMAVAMHEAEHATSHEHDAPVIQDASQSSEDCDSGHQRSGCGTCAGCCIGACAPPPVVAVTAVEEAVSSVQRFTLSSLAGYIPARIERPPRAA